jgi:hypothetical protein
MDAGVNTSRKLGFRLGADFGQWDACTETRKKCVFGQIPQIVSRHDEITKIQLLKIYIEHSEKFPSGLYLELKMDCDNCEKIILQQQVCEDDMYELYGYPTAGSLTQQIANIHTIRNIHAIVSHPTLKSFDISSSKIYITYAMYGKLNGEMSIFNDVDDF